MANKIGIGIEVDPSGISQANTSLRSQEEQAKKVTRAYKDLEEQAKKTRQAIKEMLNRDVTIEQAKAADIAFGRFQGSGSAQASYTSGYSNFSGWAGGYQQQFSSAEDARMHRSYVLDRVLGRAGISMPPPKDQPMQQPLFNQLAGAASWGAVGNAAAQFATGNPAAALPSIGGAIGGALRFIPGVGTALGAFGAAFGAGIGGAAERGVGNAQNEYMSLTDLRGNLGRLSTDFEVLQRGVEGAADAMSVTYQEATNLGKRFAEISGGRGINHITLGKELDISGGLARGFGLDPSQGVSFMASLRRYGATNDETGTRRMALLIGEAVGRVGFARAGEMMQSVTSFVQASSARSLSAPNVGGYVNALTNLVGLHPGLDVTNAAGILSRANATFQSGGAAGAASKNFMLGAYQHAYGMDVSGLMTPFLDAQGLWGNANGAYGLLSHVLKGKDLAAATHALGGKGANTATPMIDLLMGGIKSQYGDGTFMQIHALAGHLGITPVEAASLIEMTNKHGSVGSVTAKLKGFGVDVGKVNAKNIPMLASLMTAGHEDLLKAASTYGVMADGKGDEELRREVVKVASEKTVKDIGEETRDNLIKIDNSITDMGKTLLPAVNLVRDAVLFASGKSPSDFREMQKTAFMNSHANAARVSKINQDYLMDMKAAKGLTDPVERQRAIENAEGRKSFAMAALGEEFDAMYEGRAADPMARMRYGTTKNGGMSPAAFNKQYGAAASVAAAKLGVPVSFLLGHLGLESGWGRSSIGRNNLGNIKRGEHWDGQATEANVQEFDANGNPKVEHSAFRDYGSIGGFFDDYVGIVSGIKGVKGAKSAAAFAKALKAGGYATDPNYEKKLTGSISAAQGKHRVTGGAHGGWEIVNPEMNINIRLPDGSLEHRKMNIPLRRSPKLP